MRSELTTMYRGVDECTVDLRQVERMRADGWSLTKSLEKPALASSHEQPAARRRGVAPQGEEAGA